MKTVRHLGLAAVVLMGALAAEHSADACAIFAPPSAPVVTDHRMIVAVGRDRSTLYDEVRYTGSPESFAWVLPITGEAEVGLSAEVLFAALDARSRVSVQVDPKCPPQPPPAAGATCRGGSLGAAAPSDGVNVTKREVVGPYETVQLQGSDPKALTDWLSKNGFVVPEDLKPLVATYVAEKFNFLAMKLVPGANVKSMRPIRVTTKGSNVTVPLRSIAAGTGSSVKLGLWVVAEGRYEPTNFPTFTLPSSELVWDWKTRTSNHDELHAARVAATGGRGWELHSSASLSLSELKSEVANGGTRYQPGDPNAPSDYAAIDPSAKGAGKTVEQVREEDFAALLGTSDPSRVRLTFLQTELQRGSLSQDMLLAASTDQGTLAASRTGVREVGEPLCPVYDECSQVTGEVPRSQAEAQGGSSAAATSGCSTAPNQTSFGSVLTAGLGALGFVLLGLRGRSRRVARG